MQFINAEQGETFKINLYDHGCGLAVGDYDGDGFDDIYFLNQLGPNALFRNTGDGTFVDVTAEAGVAIGDRVCVAASFVDYDRDGWLDLYVGNYVDYRVERDIDCLNVTGRPDYCPPEKFPAQRDRLYRNRRDGTFEEVKATFACQFDHVVGSSSMPSMRR